MAKSEPTIDELFTRFGKNVKKEFYPFLVVSVIDKLGEATGQEIRAEIDRLTETDYSISYASFFNLLGRIKKTFGLIRPVGNTKNLQTEEYTYEVTDKGKELLDKCISEVVIPLTKILPRE